MAKKIHVELTDDISGEPGATTTTFNVDGVDYEIDLVDNDQLRKSLEPWIEKSRKLNGAKNGTPTTKVRGRQRHDMHKIRAWARDNGIPTPARGKLPVGIINAYDNQQPHTGLA